MSLIISPFTLNIFEILFLTFASFIHSFDKMSAIWQVYCMGVWGGYSIKPDDDSCLSEVCWGIHPSVEEVA